MDGLDQIDSIEEVAINLKLESKEIEIFYCDTMREWFQLKEQYETFKISETEFGINIFGEPSASVYIKDSLLRIRVVTEEEPYDVLLEVLEFVATKHAQTIDAYNYLTENEEQLIKQFFDENEEEEEMFEEEEETSSQDDWEWI